jgi:hypothetical protein
MERVTSIMMYDKERQRIPERSQVIEYYFQPSFLTLTTSLLLKSFLL